MIRKLRERDFPNQLVAPWTVGLISRHYDGFRLAGFHRLDGLFQTGQQLTLAEHELDWLAAP
jgi:hypothetical protein